MRRLFGWNILFGFHRYIQIYLFFFAYKISYGIIRLVWWVRQSFAKKMFRPLHDLKHCGCCHFGYGIPFRSSFSVFFFFVLAFVSFFSCCLRLCPSTRHFQFKYAVEKFFFSCATPHGATLFYIPLDVRFSKKKKEEKMFYLTVLGRNRK